MAILLDTQILIWLENHPDKVSVQIRKTIAEASTVYISVASIWEMAIKVKIGKLTLKQPLQIFVDDFLEIYRFELLDIQLLHIYQTGRLPLHHKDPFDRLIIAQSFIEEMEIISSDEIFDAYGVKRIWE